MTDRAIPNSKESVPADRFVPFEKLFLYEQALLCVADVDETLPEGRPETAIARHGLAAKQCEIELAKISLADAKQRFRKATAELEMARTRSANAEQALKSDISDEPARHAAEHRLSDAAKLLTEAEFNEAEAKSLVNENEQWFKHLTTTQEANAAGQGSWKPYTKIIEWRNRALRWIKFPAENGRGAIPPELESQVSDPSSSRPAVGDPARVKEWSAWWDDQSADFEVLAQACEPTSGQPPGPASELGKTIEVRCDPSSGEPFVTFTGIERVGLCLSGGGNRSATFNLGLLQGLNRQGLLRHIDYLSTVSGGGYIGAWWTAWKNRVSKNSDDQLPRTKSGTEAPAVRHLREFSNVLIPRMGFFDAELWHGIVAIVGGMVPSLMMAASFISAVLTLWLMFVKAFGLVEQQHSPEGDLSGYCPALCMIGFTASIHAIFELWWRHDEGGLLEKPTTAAETVDERCPHPAFWYSLVSTLAAGAAIMFLLPVIQKGFNSIAKNHTVAIAPQHWSSSDFPYEDHRPEVQPTVILEPGRADPQSSRPPNQASITRLTHMGRAFLGDCAPFCSHLGAWLMSIAAVIGVRAIDVYLRRIFRWAQYREVGFAAISRVLGRLMALCILWSVLAFVWQMGRWLPGLLGIVLAPLSAVAGGLALQIVRHNVTTTPSETRTGATTSKLKANLPVVLSYLAVGLAGIIVAMLLIEGIALVNQRLSSPIPVSVVFVASLAAIALLCSLVDPEQVGLFAFYRDRLVRAYLGASNSKLASNANSNRRCLVAADYDMDLEAFLGHRVGTDFVPATAFSRPLQLVCCAANDLNGDHLANLGRGARSATFSPFGMAIGKYWQEQPGTKLGTVVTASAAALNSQLGSLSRTYGPAVTFLMAALNVRLGVWRHLLKTTARGKPPLWLHWFPGWRLLKEFWSGTVCPDTIDSSTNYDIHVSDGGHFENLGLYELVRRHCRYIIVADCGADPDYKFDDLGNALRRIREDFGVEIEIDVRQLRPSETPDGKLAAQHMAVGTIHYDGKDDQGLIFVFKPNLTGDEPDDVSQYRRNNSAFPQEGTVDQFYDEAQCESYRRLGEHSAQAAFRFLERLSPEKLNSRYSVFAEAYTQWYPTPPDLERKMLEQTSRFSDMVSRLRTSELAGIVREQLPEMADPAVPPELPKIISLLIELTQMMEDAYVGLKLEETLAHPLNAGWLNLFNRVTQSVLFRCWWPVLQPLFSRAFGDFINRQCRLRGFSPGAATHSGPNRFMIVSPAPAGAAKDRHDKLFAQYQEFEWRLAAIRVPPTSGVRVTKIVEFEITGSWTLPVAWIEYVLDVSAKTCTWHINDLFVPPTLRGVGINLRVTPLIIEHLKRSNAQISDGFTIKVELDEATAAERLISSSSRAFRADRIRLYLSQGFRLRRTRSGRTYLERTL